MVRGLTYSVTIEFSELELALLYHTVMEEQGQFRTVYWQAEEGARPERRYVGRRWLENKVLGRIAETQPDWLPAMEETRKRLSLHSE